MRKEGSVHARWRRVARSWRAGLTLVLLCLSVYLPGLWSIPAVDRDEARFAQASRQMFEAAAFPRIAPERVRADFHDGGWAVPKIQDRERLNKPPLIYWLQVASAWVCTGGDPMRDAIWMYRVPSVLAAIATVLITWRLGCEMFDPRAGWLGAAMLAVAPMVVWDAHQARSDSVMMACTAGAMWGLWGVWRGARRDEVGAGTGGAIAAARSHFVSSSLRHSASFWLCLSAGIMTKGFVTPMVVGLAVVFLCRSTRSWRLVWSLRPGLGVVIVAAPLVPWVWAVAEYKAGSGGLAAYASEVWREFFVRGVAGSKEGHFWPPGMHTVALAVLFWPGSLMTLAGFVRAWKRAVGTPFQTEGAGGGRIAALRNVIAKTWSGRAAELFLIAWIVPAWVVFELSPAKLLHYTMPMLPAVALVSARCLMTATSVGAGGRFIWIGIGVLALCVAVPIAPIDSAAIVEGSMGAVRFASLCVAIFAAAMLFRRNAQPRLMTLRGTAAWVVGCAVSLGLILPSLESAWLTRAIGRHLHAIDPGEVRPVALVGYQEDSMVFLTRGRGWRMEGAQVAAWLAANPTGLVIIDPAKLPAGVRVIETSLGPIARSAGYSRDLVIAEVQRD